MYQPFMIYGANRLSGGVRGRKFSLARIAITCCFFGLSAGIGNRQFAPNRSRRPQPPVSYDAEEAAATIASIANPFSFADGLPTSVQILRTIISVQ